MFKAILLAFALVAAPAAAQSEDDAGEPAGETKPKPKKKKKADAKKKKVKKKKGEPAEDEPGEGQAATPASGEAEGAPSHVFPPWGRPGFDWTLGPILGLRYASETTDAGTTRTSTFEAGLRGGLSDIPIVPGNPGFGLGVHAGKAWGNVSTLENADKDVKVKDVSYTRTFGGLSLTGYYGFLKQALDFSRGRIEYSDDAKTVVQSTGVTHDLGLLVLPWLSTHYTYDYLRAFADQYNDPLLVQNDHWLHGRIFTDVLDFKVDLGPGTTTTTQYQPEKVSGRTDYVKMLTGLHLFWKVGASGSAKYVYNSTNDDVGALAGTRLPEQDVNQQSSVALPEDSVQASFFAGISNLYMGLGLGWRYNLQILNLSKRDGRERETTKDQGFGASYTAAF